MLYFAYGSNLNHKQMNFRCKGSKFKKKYILKNYDLCFSHTTNKSVYGHANIFKKKGSKVLGAIWEIDKKNEQSLDDYEGVSYGYYQKKYLNIKGKKVMVYIQDRFFNKKPNSSYFHIIIEGYKNCKLELKYLKNKIKKYDVDYFIKW